MAKKREKIDIVLPNKIGDAILSIPALLCLFQLQQFNLKHEYIIYTILPLEKILQALGLFKVKRLNLLSKVLSWINPSDKAIFPHSTSSHIGFTAKSTYGERNEHKWYAQYDFDVFYLDCRRINDVLSPRLKNFLIDNFSLSTFALGYFGILIDLGYTEDQIIENFKFDKNLVNVISKFSSFDPKSQITENYAVICMEAAGGKKNAACRRWDETYYIEIAEYLYANYGLSSAFIGISNKFKISDKPYFYDFRGKQNLNNLAKLVQSSNCYIGNDTGPLHLANLFKVPAIGVYLREASLIEYSPLFPELVIKIFKPDSVKDVISRLDNMFNCSNNETT